MTRKFFPSIFTNPVNCRALPVQCVVSASVSLSAGDQRLKYGSQATSGTDGGRKVSARRLTEPAFSSKAAHSMAARSGKLVLWIIIFIWLGCGRSEARRVGEE